MIDAEKTEEAFFGALLVEPAAGIVRALEAGVDESWFASDPWPLVWLACVALWKRGLADSIDAVAIHEEAKRLANGDAGKKFSGARLGVDVLSRAMLSTRAEGVAAHLYDLREARMSRRWFALQAEVAKLSAAGTYEMALTEARKRLDEILGEATQRHTIDFDALLAKCEADAKMAYHMRVDPNGPRDLNWTPGFKLPWPELTGMLGGLEQGLHVIAARPSVGKTSFAANLVRFWLDSGYRVLVNTLDMSDEGLAWRFLAERARVSIKKARFSPTRTDLEALSRARSAWAGRAPDLCYIKDVDEFAVRCKILKACNNLQIVVVDYLGLQESRHVNNGNEYERVSYVSNALKSLALSLNVPVVALCQLNREVAKSDVKRMPGLSDLRGSGSIEQDAYTVTLLHRDERVVNGTWKETPPVQLMPKPASYYPGMKLYGIDALDSVWAIVCKAQNYGTGQLPFVVRKNYFTWSLGDYTAKPILHESGYGAAKVTIPDNTPLFARVHADWRHDPLEETLERQGALIRGASYANIEPTNPTPPPRQDGFDFAAGAVPDTTDPYASDSDLPEDDSDA